MRTRKMSSRCMMAAIALMSFLAVTSEVMASSYFSLQKKSGWKTALDEGRITPVKGYYDALGAHYGTLGVDFIQAAPRLEALNNTEGRVQ